MTGLTIKRFFGAIAALGVMLIVGVAQTARATTYQWNGSSGTAWATAANWNPSSAAPAVGDIAQFASGSAYTNLPSLGAAASVDGLWQTGATAMTISGTGFLLTLTGTNAINGNLNTGIEMDPGAGALSISSSVALAAAQQWLNYSGSLLTVSRAVNNAGFGLTIAGSGAEAISGKISGAGGLIMSGGSLALSGVNTYSGSTTVSGGTLMMLSGGTIGSTAAIIVNSGGLLQFSGASNKDAIGAKNMPITVNSGGTLAVTVGNAMGYDGQSNYANIALNGGLISLSAVQYINSLTMTGGTVAGTGALQWYYSTPTAISCTSTGLITSGINLNNTAVQNFSVSSGGSLTVAGIIAANGYNLTGGGLLDLTASNTYTGATKISAGALQLGTGQSGQDGSINKTSGVTDNAALIYNLFGNQTASYAISGSGNLSKLGAGQLTLAGINSYTGTTTVSGGVLNINGGDSSTGVAVTGGTLNLNAASNATNISVTGGAAYVNTSSPATSVSVAGGATLGGTGSLASAGASVANGGILDFSHNAGNAFSLGGLSYSGSSTLNVDALANYTSVPVLSAGALSTSGQININANLGAISVLSGTYDLVSYSSIAGTGTSAFNLASVSGLSNRQSAALLEVPNQVDLVISGQTPYWSGNQPDWRSSSAWTLQPSGNPTTFQTGDADIFDDSAGNGTYGGMVLLNSGNVSPGSVTFNNSGLPYTVSGNYGIAGSGALVVQGGGSVTLVNSNGYTGATTVMNGTLQLGNGGAAGSLSPSSSISLGSNGVLAFSRSNNAVQGIDFSGSPISGAGSLVQNGPGAVILTTSNTFTGTTTINGGTLQLGTGVAGQDGSLTGTSGVTNNGTMVYDLAGTQTASYAISGGGSLLMSGTGSLGLNEYNTYSGGTTLNAGTLQLNAAANSGVGTLEPGAPVSINSGATLRVNAVDALGYYAGSTGTISLVGGAMTISPATHTNVSYVNMTAGTLTSLGAGDSFGNYIIDGGVTTNASSLPSVINANTVMLRGPGNAGAEGLVTFNVARGSGSVDLIVSSNLIPYGPTSGLDMAGPGSMWLTGSNTYTGGTQIDSGTLQLGTGAAGQDGSIGNTSGVTNNAMLAYNLYGNQTAAYAVSGSGNLAKLGQGQLSLTGSYTDAGAVTVGGGSLYVSAANSPAATVTVAGGATFGGAGTLGSLSYAGSGTFTANAYSSYPASNGAAAEFDLAINGGLNPGAGPVVIDLGGPLALSSGTYHLIQYSGALGGSGFAAFAFGTAPNTPRGQLSYSLVNDSGYVDAAVTVVPVIWTGSLSTAWNAADTLPAPMNWSYAGSGTNFLSGDLVQFDNSTASGGTVNISNGAVLPGVISFNNDVGHPYTLTGTSEIGGSGSLVKNGAGSVTIGAANSYSGGTNLNAGTLVLNNNSAIGTGALTINGGTLDSTVAGGVTLADNAQYWNGDFTFIGSQNLNMGTGSVTLASNRTVNVVAGILTVGGPIAGPNFSLTKLGGGTLTLGAANTYSGSTSVNNGTLLFAAGGSINNSAGLTVNNGGFARFSGAANSNPIGSANMPITVNSGGTLAVTVGNAMGYSVQANYANIALNGGLISLSAVQYINSLAITGGTVGGSGTLQWWYSTPVALSCTTTGLITSGINLNNTAVQTFSVSSGGSLTVAGVIAANGYNLTGGGLMDLTASNTYTGSTTISAGTLQLGTGQSGQDGSINGTSGVTNNAALAYNLFGNQSAAYAISGGGNLTKLGTGQLTLAGNNSYTGTTTVGGGVLNINGGDSSAAIVVSGGSLYVNSFSSAPSVSVAGGATLGGTGSLASAGASVANGGILDFSHNAGNSFTLGGLSYLGSSTLNVDGLANYASVPVLSAGALTTAGQININANLGAISVLSGTYDLVSYSSIAGTGTSAFRLASVAGLSNRQSAALLEVPNQVDLVVMGQTPYWSGNQPDWLSSSAWTLQPSGNPTTFQTGDADIFDDTAGTGAYGGTVLLNSGNVSPGSVTFNNSGLAYTVSGNYGITGSGSLVVQGGGSVTLVNSNGYTGATTVMNGTLQLGNGGAAGSLSPSSAIALGSNGVLTFSRSNNAVQGVDFSGSPISGAGSLVQNGPGAVILTTSNTFTGTTTINGGTLQLGTGVSGQDGSLTGTSGVSNYGVLAYNLAGTQTPAYTINGGGSLEKNGSGTLTLTTAQGYTGGTTVNGGTLLFMPGGSINNSSGITINNGGAVQFSGGTNSNPIGTANMPITVNSGGTLAVTTQNSMGYTSQSDYANIALNGGNVSLSAIQYINSITLTGGTVGGTGTLQFWYSVPAAITCTTTGTISSLVAFRNAAESISVSSGGTLTISGDLSQAVGGWTDIGSGLLVLSASNTYTGATTISGGTLQLGTGQSGQDGSIDTTSGVDISAGAALVFNLAGSDRAAYPITDTGALVKAGSGTLVLSGTNTYQGGTTVSNGTLIMTNSEAIADGTSLTVGDPTLFPAPVVPAPAAAAAVSPVPEPGTLWLLAAGAVLGIGIWRRKTTWIVELRIFSR